MSENLFGKGPFGCEDFALCRFAVLRLFGCPSPIGRVVSLHCLDDHAVDSFDNPSYGSCDLCRKLLVVNAKCCLPSAFIVLCDLHLDDVHPYPTHCSPAKDIATLFIPLLTVVTWWCARYCLLSHCCLPVECPNFVFLNQAGLADGVTTFGTLVGTVLACNLSRSASLTFPVCASLHYWGFNVVID